MLWSESGRVRTHSEEAKFPSFSDALSPRFGGVFVVFGGGPRPMLGQEYDAAAMLALRPKKKRPGGC
jgi:hypothetical protein